MKAISQNKYERILATNQSLIDKFCNSNKYIYRFLPMEYFLETMQNSQMVFVTPQKWNDPFDNFLFKQKVINPETFLKKIYVGCFTLNSHSQAYWKTYAPDGYCVRIQYNTQKLFDLLLGLKDKIWFGELEYKNEKELVEILKSTIGLKDSLESETINDTFLNIFSLKRMPFKYEEEIRIIFESNPMNNGLRKVKINLTEVISDIYLDPRMKDYETKAWKEYLAQFNIPVRKSQLFLNKKIKIQ
jgi:hypothetical protein